MADHQKTYAVEDYFTEISEDAKVVRINLKCENGKKFPISCQWFNNKVPSYSNTNRDNSLYIFKLCSCNRVLASIFGTMEFSKYFFPNGSYAK